MMRFGQACKVPIYAKTVGKNLPYRLLIHLTTRYSLKLPQILRIIQQTRLSRLIAKGNENLLQIKLA